MIAKSYRVNSSIKRQRIDLRTERVQEIMAYTLLLVLVECVSFAKIAPRRLKNSDLHQCPAATASLPLPNREPLLLPPPNDVPAPLKRRHANEELLRLAHSAKGPP